MRRSILSFSLAFCLFSAFAQSDEINISASFAQSIELRITSGGTMNWTFSSLNDYNKGKYADANFQVASSTSFEVSAAFTPFTNENGNQIDLRNLTYHIGIAEGRQNEKGVRWDFPAPDYSRHNMRAMASGGVTHYFVGFFTGSETDKTILTPGPSGNAGSFDDNTFCIRMSLGWSTHNQQMGIPILLDQNIQLGTYTCTMTLTAIPSIT
ncbi:MAG: hypothetical protein AAFR66_22355 [Bacteroidota bacterium]